MISQKTLSWHWLDKEAIAAWLGPSLNADGRFYHLAHCRLVKGNSAKAGTLDICQKPKLNDKLTISYSNPKKPGFWLKTFAIREKS